MGDGCLGWIKLLAHDATHLDALAVDGPYGEPMVVSAACAPGVVHMPVTPDTGFNSIHTAAGEMRECRNAAHKAAGEKKAMPRVV